MFPFQSPSGRSSSPFGPFLESQATSLVNGRVSPLAHLRTGSLFLPSSLPPRLQQAYDNRLRFAGGGRGGGHTSTFSVGGALSALSKPFAMPGSESTTATGLSPGIKKSLSLVNTGLSEPVVEESDDSVALKPRARRLTLEELSRGFGLTLDAGETDALEVYVDQDGDDESLGESEDVMTQESSEEEVDEAPLSSEERHLPPPSPLAHLHRHSLGTEAIGRKLRARRTLGNYSGEEGGYDGSNSESDSSLEDEGLEADGELSEDEYSNPSEEEMARVRARRRRKVIAELPLDSRGTGDLGSVEGSTSNPEDWPLDETDLLGREIPIDTESRDKGLNRDFHFPLGHVQTPPPPPRRELPSPPPPPSPITTVVNPASPPVQTSLNPTAEVFVFGRNNPPNPLNLTVLSRQPSTTSLGSAGFGSVGKPGSLVGGSPVPPTASLNSKEFEGLLGRPGSLVGGSSAPSSPGKTPRVSSTFQFKLPPDAPVFVPAAIRSPLPPSPSHTTTSSRGPLPPVPLTTVTEHQLRSKRQKVGEATEVAVGLSSSSPGASTPSDPELIPPTEGASPGKDNVRSFKFPFQSNATQDFTLIPASDDFFDEHEDEVESYATVDSKEPPSPASLLSRTPFNSISRPFSLRLIPAPSFESQGLGISGIGQRPPGPDPQPSPMTRAEEHRALSNVRVGSIDDIAIPSMTRPRSQAIAIPQRSSPATLISDLSTPKVRGFH